MARTPSNMIPLGISISDFNLLDTTSSQIISVDKLTKNKPSMVMFICNHCPFVIHLHKGFQDLYSDYKSKGINLIAVSSNDVENYPEDSPEKMKDLFSDLDLDIPYLFDKNQEFAKYLDAACTPDFYLFDLNQTLVYRGRFDESRPGNGVEVTGNDLRQAMDQLLKEGKVDEYQKPSLGCNIKWK